MGSREQRVEYLKRMSTGLQLGSHLRDGSPLPVNRHLDIIRIRRIHLQELHKISSRERLIESKETTAGAVLIRHHGRKLAVQVSTEPILWLHASTRTAVEPCVLATSPSAPSRWGSPAALTRGLHEGAPAPSANTHTLASTYLPPEQGLGVAEIGDAHWPVV